MYLDEVYLRRGNDLFVFDRREKRLFRIVRGRRVEETDRDAVGVIVTSWAKVLTGDQVRALIVPGRGGNY
jgi:hypothetical protein